MIFPHSFYFLGDRNHYAVLAGLECTSYARLGLQPVGLSHSCHQKAGIRHVLLDKSQNDYFLQ